MSFSLIFECSPSHNHFHSTHSIKLFRNHLKQCTWQAELTFQSFILESQKGALGSPFSILRYKINSCKNKTGFLKAFQSFSSSHCEQIQMQPHRTDGFSSLKIKRKKIQKHRHQSPASIRPAHLDQKDCSQRTTA